jgi:hypothetical protein
MTVGRRGIAARVMRIMPVLYSPLIASTARMATTAWPRLIPVRLILVGSTVQPSDGQLMVAVAVVLTAAVRAMTASSSQIVPGAVRSFVHSACSASRMFANCAGGV